MRDSTPASHRIERLRAFRHGACALAIGGTLIGAPVVGAQTCVGLPGPEGGRVQLGVGFSSTRGTDLVSVGVGGVGSSLFGQVATTTINYDGTPAYASQGSANLGYRVPLATGSALELCPLVGGAVGGIYDPSHNRPPGERSRRAETIASTRGARAGVAVGYRVRVNRAFTVIPSLNANVAHASLRQSDLELNNSVNYGMIGLSVGLMMGTRFTAHPYVWVPVALEGGTRWVGLAATVSLWQKRP